MNEYQRRLLDVVEYSSYIASFADPAKHLLGVEYYAYGIDALAINLTTANSPQNFNIIMDSDSDFVALYLSGAARLNAGGGTVPKATRCTEFAPSIVLNIKDQSAGKTYFNISTPMPLVCGAGGFPFILASPRIVKPRTTLTVTISAAAAGSQFNDFYFAIHGAKLFYA